MSTSPVDTSPRSSIVEKIIEPIKTKDNDAQVVVDHEGKDQQLERIATEDYPHGLRLVAIVVALVSSIVLVSLDMTIFATAIPKITDEFHSLDDVAWYASAFFLTVAAFQSTWGKAYKYFPLKSAYLISIFIFELGSLICGVANSSTTLIVGRAIAGLGGAGIASGSYTILAFSAPPRLRPAYTGIMGAAYGVSSVLGPLIGGAFTSNVTWRWCFYINLPIGGLAAAIIVFTFVTPSSSKPEAATWKHKFLNLDLNGAFLLIGSAICYLLALQWAGTTKPWDSADVIGCFIGFGLLLIAFIINEYFMGEMALLQGRLLKQRLIGSSSAFIFFNSGVFFILLYYLPIYFQSIDGISASSSGVRNLPLVIGASLFSIASGIFISVTGHFWPMMLLGSVIATVGAGLVYTLDIGSGSGQWIGYQALVGIGCGLAFQVPVVANQAVVGPSDIASVTAITLFFQTVGGAVFVSAAQTGFATTLIESLPKYAPSVSVHDVLQTGASEIHRAFAPDVVPGILRAYMAGIRVSYALGIATAGIAVLLCIIVPRTKLNTEKVKEAGGAA